MMRDEAFEALLADWLEDGPVDAPDDPVERAIAHAASHPRARWRRWLPWVPRAADDEAAPVPATLVVPRARAAWALLVLALLLALLAVTFIGSRPSLVVLPGDGLLAFSFDGDIRTVETTVPWDPTTLTGGTLEKESAPAWSPDGRLLAFRVEAITEPRSFRIDLLDTVTGARRTVADGGHSSNGRLAFSPDGSLLAFGQSADLLPVLTVAPVDGASPLRTVDGVSGSSPAFSPDGRRIAFVGRTAESARTDLYITDVATLRVTRLTTEDQLGSGWVDSPSWAEGGRAIVFEVAELDAAGTMHHHIDAVGPDGSGLRQLGPSTGWHDADDFAAAPIVSGDGRFVAFGGAGALKVLDVRSGAEVGPTLPDVRLGPGGIAWAPDMARIALLAIDTCVGGTVWDLCPQLITVAPVTDPGGVEIVDLWHLPGSTFTWDLAWQPVPATAGATP